MNSTTSRTLAALAAAGVLVGGGAAAANANGGDHHKGDDPVRSEVSKLVHDAVTDGVVTVEEEQAIKQAIEDNTSLEIESLDDVAPQG